MALRDNPFGEVRLPLVISAAAALLVALVVAAALILSDRRETFQTQAYGVTRQVGDAVSEPVSGALATPVRWGGSLSDNVRGYFFAVSENRRLKADLKAALTWRQQAVQLQDANDRYRALLGLKLDPPIPTVTGRTVTESKGPFANTRLIDVGSESGIRVGNPVMSENGLVGRVIGVTQGASRILLLTDVSSRTPVMVNRTNARAILTGDGGMNPRLDYMRGRNPIQERDLILTSGDGGVMPRGLPVGHAVKGVDGAWRIVLAADAAPVDFVRVLLFKDFQQLLDTKPLDRGEVPPPSGPVEGIGLPVAAAATTPETVKPLVGEPLTRLSPSIAAPTAAPRPPVKRPIIAKPTTAPRTSAPPAPTTAVPSPQAARADDAEIPH